MQNTPPSTPNPARNRIVAIVLTLSGALNIAFLSGVFAAAVGHMSPFDAITWGAGAGAGTIAITVAILKFVMVSPRDDTETAARAGEPTPDS